MDRSGHGSVLNSSLGKSPFSPRSRQSLNSSRRSLILPGYKQKLTGSRYSASGKSNQSVQVLTKTQYNTVENYGQPLPVMVTEALTFADNSHAFSVKISKIGWAWVVCGRRLLIWQWQDLQTLDNRTNRSRGFGQQCRELTLPQSDLSHRAELVHVFLSENSQVPSCIAVSPEGLVRYWPSIAHEGTSVEESADLQGQECDSLIEIYPQGFILATTTCSLVLIQPSSLGHNGLACRLLKAPSGWLGGLGRKMSSLIFGGLQSSQGNESKFIKVVAVPHKNKSWSIWVLASHGLQRWLISPDGIEKLLYECDVARIVRNSYCESVFENCSGDPNDLDMWLLDMQPYKRGVTILTAGVNMHSSPRLHYAFANLSGDEKQTPTQLDFFCPIKYSVFYNEDTENEILGVRFVLCGNQAYMYTRESVISVSVTHANEEYDTLEFVSSGESLLGGTVLDQNVLFFTVNYGLVVIVPNDFQPGDFGNSSMISEPGSMLDNTALNISVADNSFSQSMHAGNLSLYEMDPNDIMDVNKDCMSQLKAAFLLYIKRDIASCHNILQELFPNELTGVDSTLDRMVLGISKDLLEDAPAADPRWTDTQAGLGSSTSMQIIQQLQDKLKAFHLFIDFIKGTLLWNKLGLVTHRGNITATSYVLSEYGEKIIAAIEIRKLQNSYKQLIDNAIVIALDSKVIPAKSGLTTQDMFYVQVMKVHLLINALTKSAEDLVHSDANQAQVISVISDTNTIILNILQAIIKYRQDNAAMFAPPESSSQSEYLPWTTAMGKHGLRDSLTTQHAITLRHAARCAEGLLRSSLYDNLVNLADLILDGRQSHLESTKGTEKYSLLLQQYESQRAELIYPLVDDEQYERATSLAEKYLDFQILIQICEQTQNQARLDEYMEKFKEYEFSNYLFGWYIKEKKGGALLNRFKSKQSALSSFLGEHPTLSWIQQAMNGQYEKSCHTLEGLAAQEKELLNRKETILSLAKMAALCASDDMTSEVNQLSDELQLVQFQKELPETVLVAYGYDVNNMRVLTAQEIIHLYICEENVSSTEIHFKMALELLRYVEDPLERTELCHTIWIAAVQRDPWHYDSTENPVSAASETMFFRLIDYCFLMGEDLDEVMPPIEQILGAPELGAFGSDKSFQYLLKVGYEHIHQTHRSTVN